MHAEMVTEGTLVEEAPTDELALLKSRLKTTWMTGDYELFSRAMTGGALAYVDGLALKPGTTVLDVGCGAGQLALIAARSGARVVGCDIAPNWLERARRRASVEGLSAEFVEGDAESLPFEDGRFELVASMFGAMFAPRPHLVAKELVRVCRPDGSLAMLNWTPGGFIGQMLKIVSGHIAPSGMPSPLLWGDEGTVGERLGPLTKNLTMTRRIYNFRFDVNPGQVVDFFRANYGPVVRAFDSLDLQGRSELHRNLTDHWAAHNKGLSGTWIEAEFLDVRATPR